MNVLDAIKALVDGECKGIKHSKLTPIYGLSSCFLTDRTNDREFNVSNTDILLADDWELVNLTPNMEEVEVIGFVNPRNNDFYEKMPEYLAEELSYAKLTYSRPVKRKVKRREKVSNLPLGPNRCDFLKPPFYFMGHEVELYAEWEE